MIIATQIYHCQGFVDSNKDTDNANRLGLDLLDYQSRRDTLLVFLSEGHEYSEASYLAWLGNYNAQQIGNAQLDDEYWTVDMPSRGAGDTIAKMTHRMGIKQCAGCKKRQSGINTKIPYKKRREK